MGKGMMHGKWGDSHLRAEIGRNYTYSNFLRFLDFMTFSRFLFFKGYETCFTVNKKTECNITHYNLHTLYS